LVVLLVLLAVTALVRNRAETALVCLIFSGLMRPEAWLYIWAVALWLLIRKQIGLVRALSYSLVAPTIWLSMVWMSTGTPSHVVNQAASQPPSKLLAPTWQLIDQIPLPALVFAGVTLACFFAYIQRNRTLTVLLAAAVSAVALYQIMVTLGMASQPRYLMPGAALLIICSAWGFSRAVDALPNRRAQELMTLAVVCGLVISVPAIVYLKVLGRGTTTSVIASPDRQVAALDALSEAVGLAGGKSAVLAKGRPIMVNISMRTGMAWKLGVPLGKIAPVWPDTKASGVKGPAFAFEAPASDAGESFGLPLGVSSTTVGKSGPWRVLLIDPPGRPSPKVSR
ncbi:MAG: hypothetical protein NTX07_01815, partial [Solirubrobacterales bacterium]|nr:hypothetical protein [Solirubrobacterales bacterium]